VRNRESFTLISLTAIIAVLLTMVPLPFWLAILRPAFLVLVVLYWSTMAPYAGGIALAFFPCLALDVLQGSLIGQHAMALSLVAYLAIRFHLLVRAKPIFEQSLFVFAALLLYELTLWTIDGWSGHGLSSMTRWLYTLTSALLWPVIVGFMGRFHSPR
jgi:rod shape-determining protein MreD